MVRWPELLKPGPEVELFWEELEAIFRRNPKPLVVFDLGGMERFTATTNATLARTYFLARDTGRMPNLANPLPNYREFLRLFKLDQAFSVYATVEEAIAGFPEQVAKKSQD